MISENLVDILPLMILSVFIEIFLISDGLVRKRSQLQIAPSRSLGEFRTLKKSSSCSTIYIDDSTVSQPNLKNTIKCVSLAIYYHIKNRKSSTVLDIFDEKLRPLTVRYEHIFVKSYDMIMLIRINAKLC